MTTNTARYQAHHRPSRERDAPSDVEPLDVKKLARIWRQLPEADRLPFLVALDERIGNQLFEATMPGVADTMPDPWRSDSADVDAWVARQYAGIAIELSHKPQIRLDALNAVQLRQVAEAVSQEQVDQLLDEFSGKADAT